MNFCFPYKRGLYWLRSQYWEASADSLNFSQQLLNFCFISLSSSIMCAKIQIVFTLAKLWHWPFTTFLNPLDFTSPNFITLLSARSAIQNFIALIRWRKVIFFVEIEIWKLYNWGHIAHRYRFIVLRAEPTDCCAKDSWPAKFLIGPSKVSLSATSYIKKNCWYLEAKLLKISHAVSYFYVLVQHTTFTFWSA